MRRPLVATILAALSLCPSLGSPVWGGSLVGVAQEAPGNDAIGRLERGSLVAKAEALRAAEGPAAPAHQEEILAAYADALSSLDRRDASERQAIEFQQAADGAAAAIAATELSAAGTEEELSGLGTADLGLDALESLAVEVEGAATEARRLLDSLQGRESAASDRRQQILKDRTDVADARALAEGESTEASDPALADALKLKARARVEQLQARGEELRTEESTFDQRRDLRRVRLSQARRVEAAASTRLTDVVAALNAARRREAERKAQEAAAQAEAAAMQGEPFATLGAEIASSRQDTARLAGELEADGARIQALEERADDLTKRFTKTKRRIEIAGLTTDTGLHLRRERLRLLDGRTTRSDLVTAREDLTAIELKLFDVESRWSDVEDDDELVERLIAEAAAQGSAGPEFEELSRRLRQDLVGALSAHDNMLIKRSDQMQDVTRLLGAAIDEQAAYEDFVAERILWIRSSSPLWKVTGSDLREELDHLPDVGAWAELRIGLKQDLGRRPLTMVLVLLSLAALIAARLRVKKALAEEGALAQLRSQVSIAPTLRATALSMIVAAPYAAVLYALSWVAATSVVDTDLSRALGQACSRAAGAALIIGALRALTAKDGLEEAHFETQPDAVRLVRIQTRWLLPVMPTAALFGELMANLDAGSTADALSRFGFLVEVGSLLLFTMRVLNPHRGVLAISARSSGPNQLLTRLRRPWFLFAVTGLGSLAILSILGYGFTARSLFGKAELTVGLILALVTVRSIALRWIKLIRRREALEKLRKKRDEQRAKRLAEIERRRSAGEDVEELESEGLEVEVEGVNLASISSDLKNLIRMGSLVTLMFGAVWIWSSVFPALGAFNRVELWQHQVSVPDATGAMRTVTEAITLASLGLALLILLITWRAVSDLPSLIEIILLRRLDLGGGERYAITTLLRYLLTTVGVLLAFDKLGLAWSQLQWLVAGISVGLGFGLQEIFANFVSGITLLFERPVRVGDWVTLGDVEGVVSKIRIRATTIRDRDLKELIVPNREFITGRFINWTLSDQVSRVTATVGIAYGSDTERAIQLMLEAGRECAHSVPEPAPNVVFTNFGASSLDFELRVFVSGREIKPRVMHDLHMRIDSAFRAASIEISFPQRDLHIRSAPGLDNTTRNGPLGV